MKINKIFFKIALLLALISLIWCNYAEVLSTEESIQVILNEEENTQVSNNSWQEIEIGTIQSSAPDDEGCACNFRHNDEEVERYAIIVSIFFFIIIIIIYIFNIIFVVKLKDMKIKKLKIICHVFISLIIVLFISFSILATIYANLVRRNGTYNQYFTFIFILLFIIYARFVEIIVEIVFLRKKKKIIKYTIYLMYCCIINIMLMLLNEIELSFFVVAIWIFDYIIHVKLVTLPLEQVLKKAD